MTPSRPLTLLWLIELDHASGMRHGGNLRWFSLSRELLARGCSVYFAINHTAAADIHAQARYLDELRRDGFISGHFVLEYRPPGGRLRLAQLAAHHPAVLARLLRGPREVASRAVDELIARYHVDAVVVSDRSFLFLVDSLGARIPVVVDWVDSFVLYFRRALAMHLRGRRPRAALSDLRHLVLYYFQERYFGRRAATNFLASPVDRRCFDSVTGRPAANHALLNGVSITLPSTRPAKIPTRLIFTGNMNFPPNYEAAIWFIDEILPLVRDARPEVRFTVAGRNPVPALLSRSGQDVEILGDVPEIPTEIMRSALYVAPLISGGGFKNKVIEAITCGTFVISTSRGVEFLEPTVRDAMLVADSPAAFAQQVLRFLADPEPFDARLPMLQRLIAGEFSWSHRTEEFLGHLPRALTLGRA